MNFSGFIAVFPLFCATGALAGALAGLLGIGGGILFVPVYYYTFAWYFGIDPADAILMAASTSLVTMIPTSLSSCLSHWRKNNVDAALLKRWLPFLLAGVVLGTVFSRLYGGLWLSVLFGCILLFAALNMACLSRLPPLFGALPPWPAQGLMPLFIAGISVMLGIGGGTITVPALSLFRYDTKKAIGTSATIGTVICVPGAVSNIVQEFFSAAEIAGSPPLTFGRTAFLAVLCVIPFSMLTAPLGVAANRRISPGALKLIYSALLVFTGAKMLLGGLGI